MIDKDLAHDQSLYEFEGKNNIALGVGESEWVEGAYFGFEAGFDLGFESAMKQVKDLPQ